MKPVKEHIVKLDLTAKERWKFLPYYVTEINTLVQYYLNDLAGSELLFENIKYLKHQLIPKDYLEEIDFIASISRFDSDQILIANLYYDILKFYFGCTAFATSVNDTVFHSRNLDWHTDNYILSDYSMIFDFQRDGKTLFKTIGWPGFIGALSGTKPEKFSVTLNAVLSYDKPEIATPISFLIRDVLEQSNSFEEAKLKLESEVIISDCLLLLSGNKPHEMVVIERTPTRSAIRESENGFIVVTNDYKQLDNDSKEDSVLQSTSCGRFERASLLITQKKPLNSSECFNILKDEHVMMDITVQQMVFNNKTGEINLIKSHGKNTNHI